MRLTAYSGERYIWSLNQTARAAALYPHFPPTWQGLEALQGRVEIASEPVPVDGPRNLPWALAAFADAERRFNFKYEQVCA